MKMIYHLLSYLYIVFCKVFNCFIKKIRDGYVNWEVDGSFNNSNGIYELLIDPETNTVWHFVYKSK